ncbi:hypothetical protein AALO_G00178090 [Alosa alosa]|uniref:Uncharacterized protein n=1 Tax=Alosa alosa TaxID=278164 RepID=A0AAV6GBP4_9TELE|nr:hypothetical protein AALO_G00178090 [Alosa alosa]
MGREEDSDIIPGTVPPPGKRTGVDPEHWSQWQWEFRGQIKALRHWLKTMEMRLPPLDPAVSLPGKAPSIPSHSSVPLPFALF